MPAIASVNASDACITATLISGKFAVPTRLVGPEIEMPAITSRLKSNTGAAMHRIPKFRSSLSTL